MCMDAKVYPAMTDLGFHAAEMRTLAGRLAEACAREDFEAACDMSAGLQSYCRDFTALYVKLLSASGGRSDPSGARAESTSL